MKSSTFVFSLKKIVYKDLPRLIFYFVVGYLTSTPFSYAITILLFLLLLSTTFFVIDMLGVIGLLFPNIKIPAYFPIDKIANILKQWPHLLVVTRNFVLFVMPFIFYFLRLIFVDFSENKFILSLFKKIYLSNIFFSFFIIVFNNRPEWIGQRLTRYVEFACFATITYGLGKFLFLASDVISKRFYRVPILYRKNKTSGLKAK